MKTKEMIVLTLMWEQLFKLGHGKLASKVMESHFKILNFESFNNNNNNNNTLFHIPITWFVRNVFNNRQNRKKSIQLQFKLNIIT